MAADDDFLSFTDRLLTLIQDARTTTTYKYALLLALMDIIQSSSVDGQGTEILTTSVTTFEIAERVIDIYWRQTVPDSSLFPPIKIHGSEDVVHVPNQLNGKKDSLDSKILAFRVAHGEFGASKTILNRRTPAYLDLLFEVERTFIKNPIPRLQTIGDESQSFLYEWPYPPGYSRGVAAYQSSLRAALLSGESLKKHSSFSNVLLLTARAPIFLFKLAPLIRPLIHQKWAELIVRRSQMVDTSQVIIDYLFGSERESLEVYKSPLVTFQKGHCFYCGNELRKDTEVDHFIPWSRSPNNAVENLVAAHRECNSSKSDHFAATNHLRAWHLRSLKPGWFDLVKTIIASRNGISDAERSYGIARSQYLLMQPGKRLWVAANLFEDADPTTIQQVFNLAAV